jgi:HEAT repeat protein
VGLRPLLLLVAIEVGLLLALFGLLMVWSPVSALLGARRQRRERSAYAALRAWRTGDSTKPVRRPLDRCSLYSLRRVLETRAAGRAEDAGLPLAEVVREGPAHRKALRWARSSLWWRRLAAAQLLALIADEEDLPSLVRLLDDPHPAPASAALLAARRFPHLSLVDPLLDLALGRTAGALTHKEHVQIVLIGMGESLVGPLRDRFRRVKEEDGRVTLLQLAGRLGSPALRDEIETHLAQGGLEVRINAARALAGLPKRGSVPPLRAALEDPAWQVRAQAASALGTFEARTAAEDLLRALSDPSWWVRLRAGLALRQLGWKGKRLLESVTPAQDRYAHDMARYVLRLEDAAVWEYVS